MWRSVVLSSGGVLGEFQVGALDELKRRIPSVDLWCGAGVGALNATVLAMDSDLTSAVDDVIALWDHEVVDDKSVFRAGPFGLVGGAIGALLSEGPRANVGAIDGGPTRKIIERHSSWERLGNRRNWAICTTSLTDSQMYTVTNDPRILAKSLQPRQLLQLSLDETHPLFIGKHLHDFVQAASSIPIMFNPVNLFGHKFCEAGIRDYTPMALAVQGLAAASDGDRNFEAEVYVIDTSGAALPVWAQDQLDSGREVALRTMQIMVSEMAQNDLELGIRQLKDLVPNVRVKVIKPLTEFEGFVMDFNDLKAREGLRKLGVQRAQAVL